MAFAIIITIAFLSVVTYLFFGQKERLVKQTGTVTAFIKRSRGARPQLIYKFHVQPFKAGFERTYEGYSRLAAKNLRDEIYIRSSLSFPDRVKQLKLGKLRLYTWCMDIADQHRVSTAAGILPYIYLHTFSTKIIC